jgi:hypothetical protein
MAEFARREEGIAKFRADFGRLRAAVVGVDLEQEHGAVVAGWDLKDVLAHIGAWDRALARGVREVLAGRRAEFADYSEDEFNARAVAEARERSCSEVLSEVERAHAALAEILEQLTDHQWRSASGHSWPDATPMTVASIFDYRYNDQTHYAGHAVEIEAWRRRSSARRAHQPG